MEHKNWERKILGTLLIAVFLAVVVYFSGKKTFQTAFFHVFVLFLVINLYGLIVFDLIIFCHSKKLMIQGTEDMKEEYRNPIHHIIGALKWCAIGTIVEFISASLVFIIRLFG